MSQYVEQECLESVGSDGHVAELREHIIDLVLHEPFQNNLEDIDSGNATDITETDLSGYKTGRLGYSA